MGLYELVEKAEIITEERERQIAAQIAAKKAKQEKEAREKREKYLNNLVKQGDKVWKKIDDLIETKKPSNYDEAVKLLVDLRDISIRECKSDKFKEELQNIFERHRKKPSFIERLKSAGLIL